LYEHSLGIVEVEDALEVRDDDVVQAGEEANHEEEGGGNAHGACVGLDLQVVCVTWGTYIADGNGQESTPLYKGGARMYPFQE
jgi:hypothetical protein